MENAMSYTNKWGQTVATLATPSGMLPTFDITDTDMSGNGVTVPNTADVPSVPLATARAVATVDQDEAGTHPLSPQYVGSNAALAAEIAAIED